MRLCFALVLGLFLAVSPALAAKVTLSGQVTYRERIALPQTATLEIQLIDQYRRPNRRTTSTTATMSPPMPVGPGSRLVTARIGMHRVCAGIRHNGITIRPPAITIL